jgi:hypothetical protein
MWKNSQRYLEHSLYFDFPVCILLWLERIGANNFRFALVDRQIYGRRDGRVGRQRDRETDRRLIGWLVSMLHKSLYVPTYFTVAYETPRSVRKKWNGLRAHKSQFVLYPTVLFPWWYRVWSRGRRHLLAWDRQFHQRSEPGSVWNMNVTETARRIPTLKQKVQQLSP